MTDRQAQYREYLASPVWKSKRGEALDFYGCICNRCQEYGTDVHHKTYDRVGGAEKMEDLEVLCRECHEAHHELDAIVSRPSGVRAIHRRAIFGRLTHKQKIALMDRIGINNLNDLFIAINKTGHNEVAWMAAKLLGCKLESSSETFGFDRFKISHLRKMRVLHKKLLT